MQSRQSNINDIDQIKKVIESNQTMYGIDMIPHHLNVVSTITKYTTAPSKYIYPICYEQNNVISGVVLQTLWEDMPFWSAGNLFIDQNMVQGMLFTETTKICHDMLDYMLLNAESKCYYDYFSVVRQSRNNSRDKFLSNKFKNEYNIINVETIMPYVIPKFNLYKKLLAYTCGKNTKQLVIRHASKKAEYRV